MFEPANAADIAQFGRFLSNQHMQVDIWDADALMVIGSGTITLSHLLRGARPAVQTLLPVRIIAPRPLVLLDDGQVRYSSFTSHLDEFSLSLLL